MRFVELPVGVGGADDPVTAPRNDEEQALLGAGDQPRHGVDAVPGHHKMDAFGRADSELSTTAQHLLQLVDPHTCSIDGLLRSDGELAARLKIANRHPGNPVRLTQEADDASTGGDGRAVVRRRTADHHRVSGVVDLAFVEPDRADHRLATRGRKRLERALAAQVPHVLRYSTPGTEHVVHADAEASITAVDHWSHERVEERHGLCQMWGQLVESERALLEGLEDQGKVEMLQVAEPTVKQLAGPARGSGREITSFDQPDAQAAGDRIKCAAAACDTRANDE